MESLLLLITGILCIIIGFIEFKYRHEISTHSAKVRDKFSWIGMNVGGKVYTEFWVGLSGIIFVVIGVVLLFRVFNIL